MKKLSTFLIICLLAISFMPTSTHTMGERRRIEAEQMCPFLQIITGLGLGIMFVSTAIGTVFVQEVWTNRESFSTERAKFAANLLFMVLCGAVLTIAPTCLQKSPRNYNNR